MGLGGGAKYQRGGLRIFRKRPLEPKISEGFLGLRVHIQHNHGPDHLMSILLPKITGNY